MSTPQSARPTIKMPEQKPFKVAEHAQEPKPITVGGIPMVPDPFQPDWQPIATAPQEPDAVFLIRACANGKPISGTETLVKYRASRKMVGGKWKPAFTIVDARLGTKLGFRPTEWHEKPEAPTQ